MAVTIEHEPRNSTHAPPRQTVDLHLHELTPQSTIKESIRVDSNFGETLVILRSPWIIDKLVIFEMFWGVHFMGKEAVKLHKVCEV